MTPERLRMVGNGTALRVETIAEYLGRLRAELQGADPALVQDALASAEEYLRGAGADFAARGEVVSEAELVRRTLERFGTPEEVAQAYRESERRTVAPGPFPQPAPDDSPRSLARRIFGVVVDPRAYTSALYMFLSLATGILYFTWAVTGLSLSLGLAILIIGLPVMVAFLASLRGFSLLEGRIVEGLLGERMPRHVPPTAAQGWLGRIRSWATDRRTWTTLVYMVLQMPLGILYFTLFTIIVALTFGIAAAPFVQLFGEAPVFVFGRWHLELPVGAFPLLWLAAGLDFLLALHLARFLGRLHGRWAKLMLVRG